MRSFILSILMVNASHAATLQVCPGDVPAAEAKALPVQAAGLGRHITVNAELQAGCTGMALPVRLPDVVALYPLGVTGRQAIAPDTLLLQAPGAAGHFLISSAEEPGAAKTRSLEPLPTSRDLLPLLAARPFGVEERVRLSRERDALVLRCEPGMRPAGAVLSGSWFLTHARAGLQWSATGDGGFALAVADAALAARESSVPLGVLTAGNGQVELPPKGIDPAAWRHFTVTCPAAGGLLRLEALRLVASPGVPPPRAAWVWSSSAWRDHPRQVLQHARTHGVRTLFVSVPVRRGKISAPQLLASFIRRAGSAGIAVWTVDGDPGMVLPTEHAAAAARVRAYVAYNRAAHADARLAGLQFDVEHYLLPGYGSAAAQLDGRYAALAQALRHAAGTLPLDFVVPFWWHDKAPLMEALADWASSVTVMDYRTDPAQIAAFAQPFLDWGARNGKPVRIALEAGPVAVERQRRYERAAVGDLWQVEVGGQSVLVLLGKAQANPAGQAYRMVYERLIDGSATTFHGKEPALLAGLPGLERDFAAWSSFAGIALHELR